MGYIQQIIERLDEKSTRVISFLFNPGARPDVSLAVPIDYVSLVPLLEAIGAQLKARHDQAFGANGEIVHPDAVLDMNGLFIFLYRYVEAARRAGHPIRAMSVMNLQYAIDELLPLVEEAAEM